MIVGPLPPVVLTGPFRGMRYATGSAGSAFWPKLLGTYESCLHDELEALIAAAPARVVDVGCAEGYYAVGLARRLPHASVTASDVDPRARRLCAALAAANGVAARVHVVPGLTADGLERLVGASCLLVVDAEGAELELLRPDLAPSLATTTILVELHDFVDRSISSELPRRFAATHVAQVIDEREPDLRRLPGRVRRLPPADLRHALGEYRPERMQWAVLRPVRSSG